MDILRHNGDTDISNIDKIIVVCAALTNGPSDVKRDLKSYFSQIFFGKFREVDKLKIILLYK